ncbi:MAG TPA: pyruvate formate-lyase-activating protein [Bacilli bacterium]|nr:pyruvate formate-lyase-activating protein [Bacilli bacterium]HQC83486.1 pyruvate formate-lyase-activating protein [Bacilli bacterium]
MRASIDSIETFGLVDGPGIRTVIFFNSCKLRCLYCHNPEMWTMKDDNYSVDEIFNKIMRSKPYFGKTGGVTFSGGEPLLQSDFIIELCKKLKGEGINTCLDTAGVGNGNYDEILKYIDIVLLDIKQTDPDKYKYLTGMPMSEINTFIDSCNKLHKEIWIRQVIVPNFNDTKEYIDSLINYLQGINNITRVDFLPFHRLGREKYLSLNIPYRLENTNDMNKDSCDELYNYFLSKYKVKSNTID